jgi:hypothetical protein
LGFGFGLGLENGFGILLVVGEGSQYHSQGVMNLFLFLCPVQLLISLRLLGLDFNPPSRHISYLNRIVAFLSFFLLLYSQERFLLVSTHLH